MPTTNAPEPTRTEPEVQKDRVGDTRDTKPPLKLEAEPVEVRIVPIVW